MRTSGHSSDMRSGVTISHSTPLPTASDFNLLGIDIYVFRPNILNGSAFSPSEVMQPFFGLSDVHAAALLPTGVKSHFLQLEIKLFADLA